MSARTPSPTHHPAAMHYRREIDGLRAIAVLPVILFHAGFEHVSGGYVGVDVFFVISGYLITAVILGEQQRGEFSLARFYERRARRILPALFVVLLACLPWAWWWLLPADLVRFSEGLAANVVFASNWLFSRTGDYFETGLELHPLLHTWSLAVEEQYYLLFPLALLLIPRVGKKPVVWLLLAVAIVSLATAEWGATHRPRASFYLLVTRAWELLIGALLALHRHGPTPARPHGRACEEVASLLGLLMIAGAVFGFDRRTAHPGLATLLPCIGTALVITFASARTVTGSLLGHPVLVGIGLISYSAYLWHQPLFAFARYRSIGALDPLWAPALAAGALGLAYLSWRWVELPWRRAGGIGRSRVLVGGIAGGLLFLAIGLAGSRLGGFPQRLPPQALSVLATAEEHHRQRDDGGCNLAGNHHRPAGCVKGDRSKAPTVALFGDSHASALVHELDLALGRQGRAFRQFTKNGCPLAFGLQVRPNEHCDLFQEAFLKDLDHSTINTVIVASRWAHYVSELPFDNGEGGTDVIGRASYTVRGTGFDRSSSERHRAILQAYTASIGQLLRRGLRVILVDPIPEQGWDIPVMAAKSAFYATAHPPTLSVLATRYDARNAAVVRVFDQLEPHGQLVRVHPGRIFCDTFVAGRCAAGDGELLFYYDANHLANAGARLVADRIGQVLGPLQ